MDSHISQLRMANDNIEQHQRPLCLRIDGIDLPSPGQESGEECLQKVQNVFAKLDVQVPDNEVDRDHRVGKVTSYKGKQGRQMIVRTTTWRHRTMVFRARKTIRNIESDFT